MEKLADPTGLRSEVRRIRDLHDAEAAFMVLDLKIDKIEEIVTANRAEIKALAAEMRSKHENLLGKALGAFGALILAAGGAIWHLVTNGVSTPR